jgi:hypothetical protein
VTTAQYQRRSVLSPPSTNPAEIVITRTKVPVLRAGIGLLLLPITAILGVLLYMAGLDAFQSQLIASVMAAFGAVFGLLYFAAVAARISAANGTVRILRSFDEVVIPDASIEHSSVRVLWVSRWVGISVWRKDRKLPAIAHFVVMDTTSAGDLHPTVAALERILREARSTA